MASGTIYVTDLDLHAIGDNRVCSTAGVGDTVWKEEQIKR